ncbi:MAG TPA: hypothetical protein VG826_14055 [Pirellulales bacterium]|nr:hypothetical protein [Pirellulales bacterium]
MGATKSGTVLQALELDPSIIESLPEPVLSELVGFIEYDNRLSRREDELHEREERRPRETVAAAPVSYPNKAAFWARNRLSWGST